MDQPPARNSSLAATFTVS